MLLRGLRGPLALLTALAVLCGGCMSLPEAEPTPVPEGHTLTLIVSELQMHLDDDTYRMPRALTEDGRDVFQVALWRLDRMQVERAMPEDRWENVDLVLEFARARALERLRRFGEAADAYTRVAQRGSLLTEPAEEAARVTRRFATNAAELAEVLASPEEELRSLDERVARWSQLAFEYRGTPYEPLALEEAEAWEMLRLDWMAHNRDARAAIEAARRLVERHGGSKLYAKHLIRLGDLYGEAARRERLESRARLVPLNAARYEGLLDQAFSAYELAREQRRADLSHQATIKIEALRAYHQETLRHAP